MTAVATHCPYCALQCATGLGEPPVGRAGTVTVTALDFPTNRGGLCKKGWTAAELLDSPERILEPMQRQPDDTFAPISWSAALDRIAAELTTSRERHGPDSVAVFGGGGRRRQGL